MITTYASNRILNFLFGRESFTIPTIFYLGLSANPLGNEGTGFKEPTDTSYNRLVILNNKTSFSSANNRFVFFNKDFEFSQSDEDWGILTHFMIFDESNNIWFYGNLQEPLDIEADTAVCLSKEDNNSFTISIDNDLGAENIITTNICNKILDHIFGNSPALVPPTNFYLGVSSSKPNNEGLGFAEPSATEYTRMIIPNDKNSFTDSVNKSVTLTKKFSFPMAKSSWGVVEYFILSETSTGENIWFAGKLKKSRNVQTSTTLRLDTDDFVISFDNKINKVG